MTPLGRSLYAIGNNQEAAFHAGIRVKRIKLRLFVLSGFVCAAVGMLYAFELSSAGENIGIGFELQVITIVLLGGVSIFGGTGTILGVALAAFVYAGLRSALLLTSSFNENDFQVVSGGLLILSVLIPNVAVVRHSGPRAGRPKTAPGRGAGATGRRAARRASVASARVFAAVDLGAESGRVVTGPPRRRRRVALEVVHRFANRPLWLPDGLHWNLPQLFSDTLEGLARAAGASRPLDGIGVDAWGVDYALLDGDAPDARAAVPLPRRARTDEVLGARARARAAGGAVRPDRHPDDADQHRLPAAWPRSGERRRGGGERDRAGARPAQPVADRRARQRGDESPPPPDCSRRPAAAGRST